MKGGGDQAFTASNLSPAYQSLVQAVQGLNFGRIECLTIRNGEPCYEQPPHIVEEIKLASKLDRQADPSETGFTLKNEFAVLFAHLRHLRDGVVDIEVRHSVPFRLIIDRGHWLLLP